MIDIVFPNENEKEFLEIAKKLDYKSICFAYDLKEFKKYKIKSYKSDIDIKYAIIADEKNIKKAKNLADSILVKANDNTRTILEQNKDIIIYRLENDFKKDFIHQRRSGVNHIMCKIAKKNNITFAFSFNEILNSDDNKRNIIIGRMASNIKLCRKYNVRIIVGSFAKGPYEMRSSNDMEAFFTAIGMHASEIKSI